MSRGSEYEKRMLAFSSGGRLFQIEFAVQYVKTNGETVVAIRGKDSVVVCGQKKVPDKLVRPESVTSIYNITDKIGCICSGNINDAKGMVEVLRREATRFHFKWGYDMPIKVLAMRMGELNQIYTQHTYMRPYQLVALLIGIDEVLGPQVFKVDPSGYWAGFKAASAGKKEHEVVNFLEKRFKNHGGELSPQKTVEEAILTLEHVIGTDFKATDLEVGIVTLENPSFQKLEVGDIDKAISALADQ